MSFIKKGLKKVWSFVKKYWLQIVIVAAIVFTAGVATIGFAAFAGVSSVGGFFGAVGTTMWAGVAATAGSMGIGAGATVPTTAATVAAGTAGTQVGLGAAWGAGGGFGWGAAGEAAAANAAASTVPAAQMAGYTGMPGAVGAGGATTTTTGGTALTSSQAATHAATATEAAGVAEGTKGALMADAAAAGTKGGLTLDSAVKFGSAIAPVAGAWMMAKGEEDQLNQYNTNAAFGGNQFDGPNASGGVGPGKNFLAPPTPEGGAPQGADDPSAAATGLMQNRMASTTRPFQSIYGYKNPSGDQSDVYGGPSKPLMQGAG